MPLRLCSRACVRPALHSFPTRRSSDLRRDRARRRSRPVPGDRPAARRRRGRCGRRRARADAHGAAAPRPVALREAPLGRSEEHTSELQSLAYIVCRPPLEKKKTGSPCGGVPCRFVSARAPASAQLYTLSLHDALPISAAIALAAARVPFPATARQRAAGVAAAGGGALALMLMAQPRLDPWLSAKLLWEDRKSTRLNSSH